MPLVAWYKLDGNTLDSSGNSNDLSYVHDNGVIISNADGKIGTCYERTLVNQYLDRLLSNKKVNLISDFTMSCWAYVSECHVDTANGLISNHSHVDNSGAGITVKYIDNTDFRISCSTGDGTSRTYYSYWGTTNIKDKWAHLTLRYIKSTKNLTLWVNGNKEFENTYDLYVKEDYIGAFDWSLTNGSSASYRPKCKLDDVRIYDHALSAKEIKELSKAKILHYKFDEFQEPTTNLSLNSSFIDTDNWSLSSDSPNNPTLTVTNNYGKINVPSGDTGYYYFAYQHVNRATLANQPVTFSVKFRNNVVGRFALRLVMFEGAEAPQQPMTEVNLDGTNIPKVYSVTAVHTADSDKLRIDILAGSYYGSFGGLSNVSVEFTETMLEEKDHSTSYIEGIREGVIRDCSDYENDAVLDISTTPQWIEDSVIGGGAYKFNGVEKYIKPDNEGIMDMMIKNSFTISFWLYSFSVDEIHDILGGGNYGHTTGGVAFSKHSTNQWYYDIYTVTTGRHMIVVSGVNEITNDEWHHIVLTADKENGTFGLYRNGKLIESKSLTIEDINWDKATFPLKFGKGHHASHLGSLDDIRIYATALSAEDVLELYQTRMSLDDTGNLFAQGINEQGFRTTCIDYSVWETGTQGSQGQTDNPFYFDDNGSATENEIIMKENPVGDLDVVWGSLGNDADSGADGGWVTQNFAIDYTKKYRVTVWIRRENVGDGRAYLGCFNVCNLANGSINTNPYFGHPLISDCPEMEDNWVLFVAHIHPYDYTLTTSDPETGIYLQDGTKLSSYTTWDYKWIDGATYSYHRSFLFYSTSVNERQYFYRPRFEICDGTEPSLQAILNCVEHRPLIDGVIKKVSLGDKGLSLNTLSEVGIVDGLIGCWKLDGNIDDISGNNIHGVINGATVTDGLGRKVYTFNGTSDYIQMDNIPYNPERVTVSAWFRRKGVPTSGYHIVFGNSSLHIEISISDSTGQLRTGVFAPDRIVFNSGSGLCDGEWHMVTLTYGYGKLKAYIDGQFTGERDAIGVITTNSVTLIGKYAGYYLNGDLSDVRVYNRVLTDEEITINYKMTNPSDESMMLHDKSGGIFIKGNVKEVY